MTGELLKPLLGSALVKLYWECCVLLGPQDKRNVGKQKGIQQSAGKILRSWSICCIREWGNCLFSLKMRKLKVGLIPALSERKAPKADGVRLLSLLSPLAVELGNYQKTVTSYSSRKSDGTWGREGGVDWGSESD